MEHCGLPDEGRVWEGWWWPGWPPWVSLLLCSFVYQRIDQELVCTVVLESSKRTSPSLIFICFFPPRQKPGQIFTVSHNSHSQFLTLPCSVLINSWLCNEPFGHSSGNKAQSRPVSAPENRKPSTVVIRREILELYLDGLISTSNNPKPPVPKPPPSLPTFELPTLQQPIHNWKRSKNPSHYLWARLRAARPFSG